MGSSHLHCCMWLLPAQTISFSVRLGCPRCISASSWYNDYFSCWLLPNKTSGNVLLDLLLHTQITLFSFTPLSLIPSNAWKHISMHTFCMQVWKRALRFQQCSHRILGGIKTGAGLRSLRVRYPQLGKTQWRRGRQAAPEASGGPVFLHSSPWTHSAKTAEAREGKHTLYLRQHPSTLLSHLTPFVCCFAVELPLRQWVQPQEHTFVLQEGFCSFSSLRPLLYFAFSCLDAALSRAPHLCLLLVSPPGASFLCPFPFGICRAGGLNVSIPDHSQVTTCAEDITSAFLFYLHKPEEIETKNIAEIIWAIPPGEIRLLSIAALLAL